VLIHTDVNSVPASTFLGSSSAFRIRNYVLVSLIVGIWMSGSHASGTVVLNQGSPDVKCPKVSPMTDPISFFRL